MRYANRRTVASVTFTGSSGQPASPTAVWLVVTSPGGSVTYTYGAGAEIVRDSEGCYHYEHVPTAVGVYRYDWHGTGAVDATDAVADYFGAP